MDLRIAFLFFWKLKFGTDNCTALRTLNLSLFYGVLDMAVNFFWFRLSDPDQIENVFESLYLPTLRLFKILVETEQVLAARKIGRASCRERVF